VFWLHFLAMLKDWFEHVFVRDHARGLERACSRPHAGDAAAERAYQPRAVREADYKADLEQPMTRTIDD